MAPAYRSYVAHSAYAGRGIDGLSVTTVEGDVVVAMWQHLTGAIQYFKWDDATIPGYTNVASQFQYGVVYRPAPGAHHLDYYADNGGNNLMMVFLLTGLTNVVADADFVVTNPSGGSSTHTLTLDVTPGTIVCANGVYDAWNSGAPSLTFADSETSVYSDGGYNGWYPVRGGYKVATSASQTTKIACSWTTGDPTYFGFGAVALRPLSVGNQVIWV